MRINAPASTTILPKYLVAVVLVVLTGCTGIRAATVNTRPVFTATVSLPPIETPTRTSTMAVQKHPTVTPSLTLSPTTQPTPLPSVTPIPLPTYTSVPAPLTKRHLVVHQDEQLMFVYENDTVIYTIPVSTGAPVTNRFTPPWQGIVGDDWGSGPFRNQQRADFMWFLFPGPEGSILIHSVPYTITNGIKVYDRLEALGVEPVSNGCIRISPEDGAWLQNWSPVGVPITITRLSDRIQPPNNTGQEAEESKNE
jgi:lipoprotein-anchoring transpeptidase ErfK/SrfK